MIFTRFKAFKEQWKTLSLREKIAIQCMGVAICLLLLDRCYFSPLMKQTTLLRQELIQKKALLHWITTMDQPIQELKKIKTKTQTFSTPLAVLDFLHTETQKSGLLPYLTQLKQIDSNSVRFYFEQVAFDKFITLLINILQHVPLKITQLSITATPQSGIVSMDLTLSGIQNTKDV